MKQFLPYTYGALSISASADTKNINVIMWRVDLYAIAKRGWYAVRGRSCRWASELSWMIFDRAISQMDRRMKLGQKEKKNARTLGVVVMQNNWKY